MDEEANLGQAPKAPAEEKQLSNSERRALFGQKLRAVREQAGQTERDIIHLTRISPPFIKALEDGNFDALPGKVFGRGFIKNICKALDCDSEDLLAEYEACWETQPKVKSYRARPKLSEPTAKVEGMASPQHFSLKTLALWIGTPALVIALLALALVKWPPFADVNQAQKAALTYSSKKELAPAEKQPASPKQGEQVALDGANQLEAPAVASQEDGLGQEQGLLAEQSAPEHRDSEAGKEEGHLKLVHPQGDGSFSLLQIMVREAVEIKHRVDEEKYQMLVYEPGSYQFWFKDKADFYIFDIAKVDVEFNQQKLSWYGPQSGEKRLSFIGKEQHSDNI